MQQKSYTGIDVFRMVAALFIIAIHTAPLVSINGTLDYVVTYCIGRVGVPFFLMVAGYFVLGPFGTSHVGAVKIRKYLIKLTVLYVGATVLYIPVNLYAGKKAAGIGELLKAFFFDGTFYHLWYLPAAILGCMLLTLLFALCGMKAAGVIALILYVIGTLGDSYYGLVSQWSFGKEFYDGIFLFSSYTRNGIFYAPLFLWLGVFMAKMNAGGNTAGSREKLGRRTLPNMELTSAEADMGYRNDKAVKMQIRKFSIGLLISLALMLGEGLLSYTREWQKHNSMYFMLIPVMYFLFALLLQVRGKSLAALRDLSLWVYLIHPICIILVRGGAKAVKMTDLLVDNSLLHFLAVCVLSVLLAQLVCLGKRIVGSRIKQRAAR